MKETLVEKFAFLQKENAELKAEAEKVKQILAQKDADNKVAVDKIAQEMQTLKDAAKVSEDAKAALTANVEKLSAEKETLNKEISDLKAKMQLLPLADVSDGSVKPVAPGGAAAQVEKVKDHYTIAMELHGAERTKYWKAHAAEIRKDFQTYHNK
jgi:chromosome segregation ATPase